MLKQIYLPLLGVRFAARTDGRVHRPRAAAGSQITTRGHVLSRLPGDDRRQTITSGCGVAFVPANRFVSLFVSLRSRARSKASGQECPLHISKFNGKVKPGDDPAPSLRRAYVTLLRQGRT